MSLSPNSQNLSLDTKRHSMAHIMAAAVGQMFPEAQYGVGPVIENGCYYDFILPRTLIPEDLPLIEEKMREMLKQHLAFKVQEVSIIEAIELIEKNNQPLKVELLNDLRTRGTTSMSVEEKENFELSESLMGELKITIYRLVNESTGEIVFEDLCKGPHIEHVKELKHVGFALDKFSASYWRGDQERDLRMQRIYALVFETKEELTEFQTAREEAKKRDHRVLNETQKYYTISELVGAGLPLFQPNGMIIRQNIQDYLWQLHRGRGYKRVWTPHIAKEELYITSGHAAKFGDELFRVQGKSDNFFMKPMNCPHHMQLFADNQFSYRDMPVRYFEHATVYRDEKPGQLSGFTRVRSITQDDGHLFCRITQIKDEVSTIVEIIRSFYETVGMESSWVSLSVRDMNDLDQYLGSNEAWNTAENALEEAAKLNNLNYKRVEGEAAFYGPKLDFMFKDALGREWQLATIQCDFNLPERFSLEFINEAGEKERPVVIHRAIAGSSERFMGVIIDHFGGRFPFWLAPTQVKILTINTQPETLEYVEKVTSILNETVLMKPLKYNEIRFEVDDRSESLGKKIREAEMQKIPVLIIVGPKDIAENQVSVRTQEGESKISLEALGEFLKGV
jgi:threonyl-tRNA synthetase